MTSPTSLAALAGVNLGTRRVSYDERDAILYALAVGAPADNLALVYERDLHVLPTYGLALGVWAIEAAGDLGVYDRLRSLHASQQLEVHQALPAAGTLEMNARVADVWDKGKAAMVDIAVTCEQFTATYSIFLPGLGGWGGDRGPSQPAAQASDLSIDTPFETSPQAAALYRLTGDLHPVHIDPTVAHGYGFSRPILHGLCTLGVAARLVAELVGAEPWNLTHLRARLAAPVLPGDTLHIQSSARTQTPQFQAMVGETAVLTAGRAGFR